MYNAPFRELSSTYNVVYECKCKLIYNQFSQELYYMYTE